MKYEHSIEIRLPRDRVVALFNDTGNLKLWQKGLVSFEHQSGEPGQVGATSTLRYKMGRREIEMLETVVESDLPRALHFTYEANNNKVWNRVENYFTEAGPNATTWRTANEFRCSGMMKVIATIMPGMFKRQSLKYLKDFKKFAESR